MGNGPQARLPGRLCSFSDMGRMPHSERASPASGTAASRSFHPPPPIPQRPAGRSPRTPRPLLPSPALHSAAASRAKPAYAASALPIPRPPFLSCQQGEARARRVREALSPYASATISSFVSSAVCTSSSIFSSRFFSCLRITFKFGFVTGCFATKIVQQSS